MMWCNHDDTVSVDEENHAILFRCKKCGIDVTDLVRFRNEENKLIALARYIDMKRRAGVTPGCEMIFTCTDMGDAHWSNCNCRKIEDPIMAAIAHRKWEKAGFNNKPGVA